MSKWETLAEGLAKWNGYLWALCKGKARKPATCWMTGKAIGKGDEIWKPVTNGNDRMRRVKNTVAMAITPVALKGMKP